METITFTDRCTYAVLLKESDSRSLTPGLLFPIPGSLDFLRPVYNFTKRREIHARGSDTAFSSTVGIDKFSSGAAESKSTRVCKRCNVVTKRKFQRCRKFPLPSTR